MSLSILVALLAAAWAAPVEAGSCDLDLTCQFLTCRSPASGVPAALWGELKPVDTGQLPADRDNTSLSDLQQPSETKPRWMSIDIENNFGFVAITHGLQVWDLANPTAPLFKGVAGPSSFLSWRTDPHEGNPVRDLDAPPGNDDVVAVAVVGGGGLNVFNTSVKNSPSARYADSGKTANQVYAGRVGGTDYAFLATTDAGLLAYDLSVAQGLTPACVDSSPSSVTCGAYRGRLGTNGAYKYVDGVGNAAGTQLWIAASGGRLRKGVEIWNVSNPTNPQLTLSAFTGFVDFVHAVTLWRSGSTYYLALRIETGNPTTQVRIYDVSCIASGSCSLPAPLWSLTLTNETDEYFLTHSPAAGRQFLYFGHNNRCSQGLQNEWLYDVTNPASPQDVTPAPALVAGNLTGYWGWYYRRNVTGFNEVMPRSGKFNGQYFYRTAYSIFDIHELTSGGAPTAGFSHAPTTVYQGQPIDFTDASFGSPTSWSWTFQDATPPSSTTQHPQDVVFNSLGSKSVTLQVSNSFGTDSEAQTIDVLDPTPSVGSVTVSPNPAFQCQPITFTANNVTGFPTPTLSWDVQGTSGSVATGGNVNPFVWTTSGATPAGNYTGTVTATGTGTDQATSPTLVLLPLDPLSPNLSFTPTNDTFTGGTVQFHVTADGDTAWCWNFGDGGSFPAGCTAGNPSSFSTDPVAGPNPSHTYTAIGIYPVIVHIRNCNEGPNVSAALTVNITQVTPLEAEFHATGGVSCFGNFCQASVGVPVTFTDQSQGNPTSYAYDFNHIGTSDATCSFGTPQAAPDASHTFTLVGNYQPCLKVFRGTETSTYLHAVLSVVSGGGGGNPGVTISGPTSGTVASQYTFNASASNCTPNASGWTWSTAGGTGSSTSSSITLSWSSAGTKTISVTNAGCGSASDTHSISISTGTGGGGGALEAHFNFTPALPTPGQQVSFDAATSTGSPTAYSWTFGDNTSGTGVTATHTYGQSGTYQVRLDVSKPGASCPAPHHICISSITRAVVVSGPVVSASFTTDGTCGPFECTATTGDEVSFTSTSQNATIFDWTFGDNTSATGANVAHTWDVAGNYQVVLTARDGQGGSAQATKLFRVEAPPVQNRTVVLPWIAQTRGAIVQSSDLYVMNPGDDPIDVEITFRVRGTPETTPPTATRTVAPKATFYAPDALGDLFGREETGGFLVVTAQDVAVAPVVVSLNRTFQTDGKTYGQLVPGIGEEELADLGRESGGTQYLLGLFDTDERLTQIGLTNPHPEVATYRLRFFDNLGNVIASTPEPLAVAPWGQKQFQVQELRDRFGLVGRDDYRVEVVQVSGQTLFAYAGVIRTGTEDPSFVEVSLPNLARTYLVGATSTPGFNNALFVTDAVISNPANQVMSVDVRFKALGVESPVLGPVTVTLLQNETQRVEDVLFDRFDLHNSVGVLTFDSAGAGGLFPLIHGEVYQDSGPQARYGLFMPARRDSEAAAVGQQLVLAGLGQEQGEANTSLLLFNPTEESALCDIVYYGLDGHELGRLPNYTVSPGGMRQINPSRHPLPAAGVADGFSVVIDVKAGKLMGGAQVVINQTNDPAYISAAVR